MLQNIIVGLIVAACALYLLHRFVFKPKSRKSSGCGSCNACCGTDKPKGGCH